MWPPQSSSATTSGSSGGRGCRCSSRGSPPPPTSSTALRPSWFVSQAVQTLIVSLTIGAFFVVFGMLAIDETVRQEWIDTAGTEVLSVSIGGDEFELTEQLLRVAGGLAAFSGFYFAVAMLTNSTYREEFLEELTDEMRVSFTDRERYLRLRSADERPFDVESALQ